MVAPPQPRASRTHPFAFTKPVVARASECAARWRARAPPPFRTKGGWDSITGHDRSIEHPRGCIASPRARSMSIDAMGEITAHYAGRREGTAVGARAAATDRRDDSMDDVNDE